MSSPTSRPPAKQPLGRTLVQEGLITVSQLDEALAYKSIQGGKLGQALVALGFLEEKGLITALRAQGRISCISLKPSMINLSVATALGEEFSRRHMAVAINKIAGYTTIAMNDPQDVRAIDEMRAAIGDNILSVYADSLSLVAALEFVFGGEGNFHGRRKADGGRVSLDGAMGDVASFSAELDFDDEVERLGSEEVEVDDEPIINLVRAILVEGFLEGASDIHIEPHPDFYMIRYRVDGSCFEKTRIPKSWGAKLMVRVKLLADLDISQRRLPQDGRAQFRVRAQRVDLRVATSPSVDGESAVIRILDGGREMGSLSALGLREEQVDRLRRMIRCKEGFVLATGPTGSGKTTTLYGLLKELSTKDNKVITLEDPVENVLEGVTQISTHAKIGLTFEAGLRSILRQDPDIVLVGEIRDRETASIAIEASMTGHIVLSTLHTVGSVESITRLIDLGVDGYLIGDTLKGIVAQRLVRRICPSCSIEVKVDGGVLAELGITDPDATFHEGIGCDQCRNLGFKGRVGIYEILLIDNDMRTLISSGASKADLLSAARAGGMQTLREEGLRLALSGEASLAEILSLTN